MIAASTREDALPSGTEHRLAAFTGLIATAIAGAEAQAKLTTARALRMPKTYATRRYSWITPPARSRRPTRKWSRSVMWLGRHPGRDEFMPGSDAFPMRA